MATGAARLLQSGFELAGHWVLIGERVKPLLVPADETATPILYAFCVDGEVAYIGKTADTLTAEMQGYTSPGAANPLDPAKIRNHQNILAALRKGGDVSIFKRHVSNELQHNKVATGVSAGLEDKLLSVFSPAWNQARAQDSRPMREPRTFVVGPAKHRDTPHIASATFRSPTSGQSDIPTAAQLMAYAQTLRGQRIETLTRGYPFTVGVWAGTLEITPASSAARRRESKETIAKILLRYEESRSFTRSVYSDLSFNGSYVLALLRHWQQHSKQTPR